MTDDPIKTLRGDPTLRPIIDEHGRVSIEPADDTFKRLVISIINQQLSSASAAAIRDRIFDTVEITPTGILSAEESILQDAGLSSQKITYLQNIAAAYRDQGLNYEYFADKSDAAVIDELTDIHGIGAWTAKMYLIFCLGREDVFPVEDLGIRNGMRSLYHDEMSRSEMVETADAWRPYRSYATRYIWRGYDD